MTTELSSIVVVDDEEDSGSLLRDLLERRGYRATAVRSGDECLEYLGREIAHVIITDMVMPGMSGIDLCRELRIRHPALRAIVLTGAADLDPAGALRAGASEVLTKPVKTDVLDSAIRRALQADGGES